MNNAAILDRVARREVSPEEAVRLMQEADQERRARLRPAWAPPLLWAVGLAVIVEVLAAFGFQQNRSA